jgi:hypothetical protein
MRNDLNEVVEYIAVGLGVILLIPIACMFGVVCVFAIGG